MTLQNAFIALKNAETVTSFEYYDRKNKLRVAEVKQIVTSAENKIKAVKEQLRVLKEKFGRNGSLLDECNDMVKYYAAERERVKQEQINKYAEEF